MSYIINVKGTAITTHEHILGFIRYIVSYREQYQGIKDVVINSHTVTQKKSLNNRRKCRNVSGEFGLLFDVLYVFSWVRTGFIMVVRFPSTSQIPLLYYSSLQ